MAGAEARYHLPETIRQYYREQLAQSGEFDTLQGRHLSWYVALVEETIPSEPESRIWWNWYDRMEQEHDNFRVALAWSQTFPENAASVLRLVSRVWLFWAVRGHLEEGRQWLAAALERPSGDDNVLALAMEGAGSLALQAAAYDEAQVHLEASLSLARSLGNRGLSRSMKGLTVTHA